MEKEQPKMSIDPTIKEEINKEGWEKTGDKDEWAVLIGKKEEMPQLLEKLETEGKTADLETYIKLHKEIILPSSEIKDEELKKDILDNKGIYWQYGNLYNGIIVKYFDKDGNYAEVNIRRDDIASLKSIPYDKFTWEYVAEELKKLHFTDISNIIRQDKTRGDQISYIRECVNEIIKKYKEKLEKESTERKKEEFDF